MDAEIARINPPVLYATLWWVVAAGCLLGCAVVVIGLRRALRRSAPDRSVDVESLRAATLDRIATLLEGAPGGDTSTRRAVAGRVGAEVRRFLGTVTGTDLDYTTRREWVAHRQRDPRLVPAVDLLLDVTDAVFSPSKAVDLANLGRRAVEVVTSWR